MGQTYGVNTNEYVKICTVCHEEKFPQDEHCEKCRKKGFTYFGFALLFALIAWGSEALNLNEDFVALLYILFVISVAGGIYYCRSKVTIGTVKGQYVEFYE